MAHQNKYDNESIKSTVSVHMILPLLINWNNSSSDKEFSISDSSLSSNSTSSMPVLRSDYIIYILEESDDDISTLGVFEYP